jgi:nucleoside 2-deoxyribosyltransferase
MAHLLKAGKIYLAGPIRTLVDGTLHEYDLSWRDEVKRVLEQYNIECLDPTETSRQLGKIEFSRDMCTKLRSRDISLLNKTDVLLVNLLPHTIDKYNCYGTLVEIGYCQALNIPVFIVAEEQLIERLICNPMFSSCKFFTNLVDAVQQIVLSFYNSEANDCFIFF